MCFILISFTEIVALVEAAEKVGFQGALSINFEIFEIQTQIQKSRSRQNATQEIPNFALAS